MMTTMIARNHGKPFNLELFFELSPDLICIAGYDGYFKRINPTVSRLLGYTNDELMARPIAEFIYPEDKDITAKNRENLLRAVPLLNFENRYVTKGGEAVWLSWTSMPIESEQVVFAIAKNISHEKKVEQDRNLLITTLKRINDDLKQLSYTTSHDLRTPVSNMLSVFNLLDISKIQDEETLEFITILRSATESLKSTLNNYVDVLIQKEEVQVLLEEVGLQEALDIVLRSLSAIITNSGTSIAIDFAEVTTVKFNKAYLESIFLNLVTNAIKYARPGISPVISVSSRCADGVRQLIFADKGQGFDMEKVKDKIFGFHQKFSDNADSKGIGLYLVHSHITSLGGHITVESRVNEGTTFVISFKD